MGQGDQVSDESSHCTATWDSASLQRVHVTHPGLASPQPEPQPTLADFALLIELHNAGQLTAGKGSQIVREAAARKAMRERCAMIGSLHMQLAKAFFARSTAITDAEAKDADEKIGDLQARLKNAES